MLNVIYERINYKVATAGNIGDEVVSHFIISICNGALSCEYAD